MRKSNIIKKELEESIEQSKAAGLAADEKEFIAAEVKELEQELEKALEAEKKPEKTPKEPKAPKEKKPVVKKEKMKIVYKGKEVNEDDPEFCSKIVDAWRERKEASKKAEGKRKTKPVIQRVAANIASAVAKGISSIEVEDIKKDPKAAIKQMEELEAAGKDFLAKYKAILGDKITQKEIAEEFSGLDKAIAKISEKYLEKTKKEDGGEVDNDSIIFDEIIGKKRWFIKKYMNHNVNKWSLNVYDEYGNSQQPTYYGESSTQKLGWDNPNIPEKVKSATLKFYRELRPNELEKGGEVDKKYKYLVKDLYDNGMDINSEEFDTLEEAEKEFKEKLKQDGYKPDDRESWNIEIEKVTLDEDGDEVDFEQEDGQVMYEEGTMDRSNYKGASASNYGYDAYWDAKKKELIYNFYFQGELTDENIPESKLKDWYYK